jgi:hypothetical protein
MSTISLSITELTTFLSPSTRLDVRTEAAKNALSITGLPTTTLTSGDVKQVIDDKLIPSLVKLIGDVTSVSKPCIEALVNLSAIGLFIPKHKTIVNKPEFWKWIIEEIDITVSSLLVNLTSTIGGPEKINEFYLGGAGRACAHILEYASIESRPIKYRENAFAIVRNLTTIPEAQSTCVDSVASIKLLLSTCAMGTTPAMRRDSAGSLRHILLNKDSGRIARILAQDGAGWLASGLILALGSHALIDDRDDKRKEREGTSPVIRTLYENNGFLKFLPSPGDRDAREIMIDCLICIASKKAAREKLREIRVYPLIRAYHPNEEDKIIHEKVTGLVELLIATEEELAQQDDDDDDDKEREPHNKDVVWEMD